MWVGRGKRAWAWACGQFDGDDVLVAAGVALMSGGLAFVFWPAALLVPGAALVAVGVLRARG